MYTISGTKITMDEGVFTVEDVGYQLARVQRWGGATFRNYSVAQHSLAMLDLFREQKCRNPRILLLALWHDAHEIVTGDGCPPFHTTEGQLMKKYLDLRLWQDTLKVPYVTNPQVHHYRKLVDDRLAAAEAHEGTILHPRVAENFRRPPDEYLRAVRGWLYEGRTSVSAKFTEETYTLLKRIEEDIWATTSG